MVTYEQALAIQQEVSEVLSKFDGYDRIAVGRDNPLAGDYKVIVTSSLENPGEGIELPEELNGVQIKYIWNCTSRFAKALECPN